LQSSYIYTNAPIMIFTLVVDILEFFRDPYRGLPQKGTDKVKTSLRRPNRVFMSLIRSVSLLSTLAAAGALEYYVYLWQGQ
jgi:hypothetical protein